MRLFTEMLRASETLAAAMQDRQGALLSRTFLAAADPAPAAAGELDTIAATFSSIGFVTESTLAHALSRIRAGDTAAAASLLRERPETATIADAIAHAAPEDAVKLLLPYVPMS